MAFFTTKDSSVFPSTYRIVDNGGKYTSERNLTNILKAISSSDSFVVGYENVDGVNILKFVINGYYFEIKNITLQSNLYVGITVKNDYLVSSIDESPDLDVDSKFTGCYYDFGTAPTGCLQITNAAGELINLGYISPLTDADGNWIDISNLVFTDNGKIDASSIDFSTLVKWTEALNLMAGGALALYKENGSGNYVTIGAGSGTKLIYFANGVPVESNSSIGGTDTPVYLNSGTITKIGISAGGVGLVRNEAIVTSGKITNGNKITISTSAPTGAGSTGDLWYVIGG